VVATAEENCLTVGTAMTPPRLLPVFLTAVATSSITVAVASQLGGDNNRGRSDGAYLLEVGLTAVAVTTPSMDKF